jgi:hypothetical protein
MPSNLSHCLSATAACGIISFIAGLPPISGSVFFGGLAGMLINLDYSSKEKLKRTPLAHSIYSPLAWSTIFLVSMMSLHLANLIDLKYAMEFSAVFTVAFLTHSLSDLFTTEGLYVYTKGNWEIVDCKILGLKPLGESSALLNIYVCIPSTLVILVLVGIGS